MDLIMPDNFTFKIRPVITNDLNQAISLSNSEGWNQTEKDWKLLLENPLNTCLVAEHNNTVIGTATALNHSNKVAWIGMVLVDKRFRGQGVGKMLLRTIIDALKNIDSIKLDATPAGLPLYEKLGFINEYMIYRMINPSLQSFSKHPFSYEPVNVDRVSLSDVKKLDERIFGIARTYLLQALLRNYPGKAYLINRNNNLDGYMFGRDGIRFNYIGPVCAFSNDSARILILKALESLDHQPVALDILQDKEELIKWLESLGFIKQRHFIRMYLKSNSYSGLIKNNYLISGPEYG
jgi:GNAT superfamily N-acetyltransferase